MGPSTRSGCEAACIVGNMPCTGCLGPTSGILDAGAKAIGAVASCVDATDPQEIARRLDRIVDLPGTFYRYSLPSSLLHGRPERSKQTEGNV